MPLTSMLVLTIFIDLIIIVRGMMFMRLSQVFTYYGSAFIMFILITE